ncbi:MAG: peptidoglycan-binding protein [Variibacter sp.]|nr:peptidoglycan-binding protein [Variibacter sp.]
MTSETIHSEGGAACIVVTPIGDAGRVNVVAKGYMRVSATFDRASAARLAGAIFTAAGIRYVLAGSGVDSSSWTGARQVPEAEGFDYGAVRGTVGFIEAFQRAMGLRIDGIVGPETIAALKRLAEGRADRPASAGDIDMAVDRILSAVAKGEASAITLDDGCVYGKDAIQYLRDLVDRREAERDAARGDAAREKAAAANLATRLDKTEREWRAEEAARRAIQEERGRLTVEARERQRILEQTEAERDQARQQRDDYKRRLDAFGVRGDKPYLYQGQIGDVALIPGGHWCITYVRATSSGEYRIEMEPVDG